MPDFSTDIHTDELRYWAPIRAGEQHALAALFDTYARDLHNYGRRLGCSEEDIYDWVQEVFTDLWQNRKQLPPKIITRPYLFGILRNKLNNFWKRQSRMATGSSVPDLADNALSVEDFMVAQEEEAFTHAQLEDALTKLPGRQQEIILLRFYHGLSYEEISTVTGLQYQSVRNSMHKAMLRLREWIAFYLLFLLELL